MFLIILALLCALSISGVAIYYSVIGLASIFAAAKVPIYIMGGVLEVSKLVTASWLYQNWKNIPFLLKSYLFIAVAVLMLITSMGIFGFLSKAHIEQTASGEQNIAEIERIDNEIARYETVIVRAEQQIEKIESQGNETDNTIQEQIDREQERISTAYERIQPSIDAQNEIIKTEQQKTQQLIKPYEGQITAIDQELNTINAYIDVGDRDSIKKVQQIVGVRADGSYGSGTAKAVKEYKDKQQQTRNNLLGKIEGILNAPNDTITQARGEISRLKGVAEDEIKASNELINRLQNQIATVDVVDVSADIDEQMLRIKSANDDIDTLIDEKFALQSQNRILEAEVGPIKYIAEFIYGEQADKNLMEQAVTWLIIIIVAVFDPLAVLLLIAVNMSLKARYGWTFEGKGALEMSEQEYKTLDLNVPKKVKDLERKVYNKVKGEHNE